MPSNVRDPSFELIEQRIIDSNYFGNAHYFEIEPPSNSERKSFCRILKDFSCHVFLIFCDIPKTIWQCLTPGHSILRVVSEKVLIAILLFVLALIVGVLIYIILVSAVEWLSELVSGWIPDLSWLELPSFSSYF